MSASGPDFISVIEKENAGRERFGRGNASATMRKAAAGWGLLDGGDAHYHGLGAVTVLLGDVLCADRIFRF
jgi:hypothetical protein